MQQVVRAKSAWASLLKPDFSPDVASTLMQTQICKDNGKKTFAINPEDVISSKKKWSTAIIGQVMGNPASFFNMKKFAEDNWTSMGLLEVQRKEEDLFVFRFQSDDAKQSILDLSPLPFGNRVLFLWPWSPETQIQRLSLDAVPVWVKLPDLKLHYFNATVLSGLGSLIGKPLFMDKLTTTQNRIAFARICVEIKAGEEPPRVIYFIDENGKECMQEVLYEWVPSQCPKCKTFGHNCLSQPTQPKVIPGGTKQPHPIAKPQRSLARKNRSKSRLDPKQVNSSPSKTMRISAINHSLDKNLVLHNDKYPLSQAPSLSTHQPVGLEIHSSQNKFEALREIGNEDDPQSSHPSNQVDLEGSTKVLDSDLEGEERLDVEYNNSLAEQIRIINSKIEKDTNDSSWYLSSSSENDHDSPSHSKAPTQNHGTPYHQSKLKSVITKSNAKNKETPEPRGETSYNRFDNSFSPPSRPRNRSRGRPRGAKSKR